MGIHGRIAVTGKMLGGGQHSTIVKSAYRLSSESSNYCRVVAIAARANNRVHQVIIDVDAGGKIKIHAHRTQLPAVAFAASYA